ncbi:MAG: hypothetical protein WD872_15965 [Pirellulaceae bacterium]
MFENNTPLLLFAAMLSTTVLLAVGSAFGYWTGTRSAARLAAAEGRSQQAPFLNRLASCTDSGQQTLEQSLLVATLARNAVVPVPAELSQAIEKMTETTTNLAEQLRQLQASGKSGASVAEPTNSAAPRRDAPPLESERLAPRIPQIAQGSRNQGPRNQGNALMTSAEMSEADGEQHPPGNSAKDQDPPRYPYDCEQQMAPWTDEDELPTADRLVEVRCHDISANGISFFWPNKPEFDRIVISIGGGDRLAFMAAQVCDHKAVYMHQEHNYIVCCRFLRRVEATEIECRELAVV